MKENFSYNIHKQKIIFVFAIFLMITSCKQNADKKYADKNRLSTDQKLVSALEVKLPDAQGADAFRMNCVTCHSARYVQMQPLLARTTWEKIVDKMVKNYGAPISDSVAKNIVDYLVSIKGKR